MRHELSALVLLCFLTGCESPSAPPVSQRPANEALPAKTESAADPAEKASIDPDQGYLHARSGVGFMYPEGWQRLPVQDRGRFVSQGLNRDDGTVVTLYWSEPDAQITEATVGNETYVALESLYGQAVSRPKKVTANGRPGFVMKIDSAPLGVAAKAQGAVYVFAVQKDGEWWQIKLRATAPTEEGLADAEKLLENYRW